MKNTQKSGIVLANDMALCTDIACPMSDLCLRHNTWLYSVQEPSASKQRFFITDTWDGTDCDFFIKDEAKREMLF